MNAILFRKEKFLVTYVCSKWHQECFVHRFNNLIYRKTVIFSSAHENKIKTNILDLDRAYTTRANPIFYEVNARLIDRNKPQEIQIILPITVSLRAVLLPVGNNFIERFARS